MKAGEVVGLFLESVWRELNGEERDGLHVTELVELEICERKFWFRRHLDEPPDVRSLLRMWKGRKLHETAISVDHEMEVEHEGVKGRIDEVFIRYDENYTARAWLVDKKFVGFLPASERDVKRYYSHYILQLELYAYMYTVDRRTPVEGCVLLFVNTEEEPYFHVHAWKPNLRKAEKTFRELRTRAEEIDRAEQPPPRNPDYMPSQYPCTYCDYTSRCYIHPEFNSVTRSTAAGNSG